MKNYLTLSLLKQQGQEGLEALAYIERLMLRCNNSVDTETMILLAKDHGYEISEGEIPSLIHSAKTRELSRTLYNSAKHRATQKGYDFTLTLDWVYSRLIEGVCEKTKIPFKYTESEESNPYAPSIDRIDSDLGYTKENSRLVLISYNKFKSDYKESDIDEIVKRLVLS